MSSSYPGPDPDDPFSRPPNESGAAAPDPGPATPSPGSGAGGTEETAPIQREEMGYWEKKALEDQARLQREAHQQAQYGTGSPSPYGQPPQNPAPPDPSAYGAPQPTTAYPSQPYGQPAGPAYGQPGYPAYGYPYPAAPNHPSANTALTLGLIGLIGGCVCGLPLLVAPFAIAVGAKAKREIEASHGQLGGAGNAQAGFVMGIVGSALLALMLIFIVIVVIAGIASDAGGSSTGTTF